ncbi:MAG: CHRD domain-containing protein [Carbonactinosporaceae bacterium]
MLLALAALAGALSLLPPSTALAQPAGPVPPPSTGLNSSTTAAPDSSTSRSDLVVLTGAQEAPGLGDPDGSGWFGYGLSLSHRVLCYGLTVEDIAPPTAAHIHIAPPGVPGPIVVTLDTPSDGDSSGCIRAVPDTAQTPANATLVLTESELTGIATNPGAYYANVHNGEFPAGAVRGQL